MRRVRQRSPGVTGHRRTGPTGCVDEAMHRVRGNGTSQTAILGQGHGSMVPPRLLWCLDAPESRFDRFRFNWFVIVGVGGDGTTWFQITAKKGTFYMERQIRVMMLIAWL